MQMNIMNEPVRHQQFGSGTVTDQTATRVTVEFCEKHGIKKFSYPYAFNTFLELSNPVLQQSLQSELSEISVQEELDRQKNLLEAEQRKEAGRLNLLKQKRETAKKKPSSKKSVTAAKEKGKD